MATKLFRTITDHGMHGEGDTAHNNIIYFKTLKIQLGGVYMQRWNSGCNMLQLVYMRGGTQRNFTCCATKSRETR